MIQKIKLLKEPLPTTVNPFAQAPFTQVTQEANNGTVTRRTTMPTIAAPSGKAHTRHTHFYSNFSATAQLSIFIYYLYYRQTHRQKVFSCLWQTYFIFMRMRTFLIGIFIYIYTDELYISLVVYLV